MANNLDVNLDGLTDSVNKFIKTLDLLDRRFEAFGSSATLSNAFGTPKEIDSYISSINRLDTVASSTFKNLIREITRLQKVSGSYNASNQGGLTGLVNEIIEISRKLGEIGDNTFDVKRVTGLFDLVAVINKNLIGLGGFDPKAFDDLNALGDVYSMIGKSVGKMLKSIDKVQTVDYNKLKAFTDVLSFIQVGIGRAINKGAKVAAVDDFRRIGTSINNLAKAIPLILDPVKAMPKTGILQYFTKARRDLVQFFKTVGFILSGVSKAVSKAKIKGDEGKNIRQMSTALLEISKSIPQLIRNSQQLPALGGWFRAFTKQRRDFSAFLNSIKFIVNQVGKIKVKKGSISGLVGIATFMDKMKAFNWRGIDYAGMDEFTKKTEKSFGRLNRLSGMKMPPMPRQSRRESRQQGRNSSGRNDAGVIRAASSFAGQMPNALTIAKGVLIRDAVQFAIRNLGQFASYMLNYRSVLLRSIKNIGDTLRQGGQTLTNIGRGLLTAFNPTKIFRSAGFNLAVEFQAISTQIKVFGDLSDEQTKKAQDLATAIGIKFPLSANAALASILDLIKAGRSLEEVEFLLPATATLASLSESGNLDMVTKFLINAGMNVRKVTEDIVGGFGSIEAVTDVIFRAANATTASVDGLIEGMREGILAGKALGLTLEETAAALSIFEDAEIRGSEAGTALRTFESALNKMDGENFQEKLANALALTDDRTFGDTRAVQALRIFRDAEARGGIDALVEKFQASITASQAFAETMNNLKGEITQLQGSFETAQQVAFDPLLSRFFMPMVKIARLVVDGFIGLDAALRETIVTSALLVGVLGALSGAILLAIGGIAMLSGGFTSLVASMGLFIMKAPFMILSITSVGTASIVAVSGLFLMGGAILAVGASITKFYRLIENKIGGADTAFSDFRESASLLGDEVGKAFKKLQNAFSAIFGGEINDDRIKEGERLASFFDSISVTINNITESLSAFDAFAFLSRAKPAINQLREGLSDIGAGILGIVTGDDELSRQGARGISTYGRVLARTLNGLFGVNMEDAIYSFDTGNVIKGVRQVISNLIKGFQNLITSNKDNIVALAEGLFQFLNPFDKIAGFTTVLGLDGISTGLRSVADTIQNTIGGIVGFILDAGGGKSAESAIEDNFGELGEVTVGSIKSLSSGISIAAKTFSTSITSIAKSIDRETGISQSLEAVSRTFETLGESISRGGHGLLQAIQNVFVTVIGEATQFLIRLPIAIIRVAGDVIRSIIHAIGFIGTDQERLLLQDGGASFGRLLSRFIGVIGKRLLEFGLNVISTIKDTFIKIVNYIATGGDSRVFTDGFVKVINVSDIISGIISIMKNVVLEAIRAIGDVFSGLGEALGLNFLFGIGDAIKHLSPAFVIQEVLNVLGQVIIFPHRILLDVFGIDTSFLERATHIFTELLGNFIMPAVNAIGGVIKGIVYWFNAFAFGGNDAKVVSIALAIGLYMLIKRFGGLQQVFKQVMVQVDTFIPQLRRFYNIMISPFKWLNSLRKDFLGFIRTVDRGIETLGQSVGMPMKAINKALGEVMSFVPIYGSRFNSAFIKIKQSMFNTVESAMRFALMPIINPIKFLKGGWFLGITNMMKQVTVGLSNFQAKVNKVGLWDSIVLGAKSAVIGIKSLGNAIKTMQLENSLVTIFQPIGAGIKNMGTQFATTARGIVSSIVSITKAFLASPFFITVLISNALTGFGVAMKQLSEGGGGLESIAIFLKEIIYGFAAIFGLDRENFTIVERIFDGITQGIRDVFDWILIQIDRLPFGNQAFSELNDMLNLGTEIEVQVRYTADDEELRRIQAEFDRVGTTYDSQKDSGGFSIALGDGVISTSEEEINAYFLSLRALRKEYMDNVEAGNIIETTALGDSAFAISQINDYFEEIANLTEYGTQQTEVLRNQRDAIMYSFNELVSASATEYANGLAGYFESAIESGEDWRVRALTSVMEGTGMIDAVADTLGRDSKAFGYMFNTMSEVNKKRYINDYLEGSFRIDLANTDTPEEILSISRDLQGSLRDGLIDEDFYNALSQDLSEQLERVYSEPFQRARELAVNAGVGFTQSSISTSDSEIEDIRRNISAYVVTNVDMSGQGFSEDIREYARGIDWSGIDPNIMIYGLEEEFAKAHKLGLGDLYVDYFSQLRDVGTSESESFRQFAYRNNVEIQGDFAEAFNIMPLDGTRQAVDILNLVDYRNAIRDGLEAEYLAWLSNIQEGIVEANTTFEQYLVGIDQNKTISDAHSAIMPKIMGGETDNPFATAIKAENDAQLDILQAIAATPITDQSGIDTITNLINTLKALGIFSDETAGFLESLAYTNREVVQSLYNDSSAIQQAEEQAVLVQELQEDYERIIALATELESGAISSDNIADFIERLMLAGGGDEANTEAYGAILEQLRMIEESGLLVAGTANAVDNYFRLIRQGRATLDDMNLSQSDYNQKLNEYLRLMGAIDTEGNAVLPTAVAPTDDIAEVDTAAEEMQTRLEEMQTEFDAEIGDFDKEYIEKEKERQVELLELESDYRKSESERLEDYNIERKRALEDHLNEMKGIGNTDFKDAVANRNVAQAIEALQRQKETKEKFDLDEQRTQQDLVLEQQRRLTEYNNKVSKIREQIGLDFHQYHVERQARISAYQQKLRDEGLFDLYMRNIQQRRAQQMVALAESLASPFVVAAQTAINAIASIFKGKNPPTSGLVGTTKPIVIRPGQLGVPVAPPRLGGNRIDSNIVGRRQNGGISREGKRYSIVEDGKPEVFTPGRTGRITGFDELKSLIGGRGATSSTNANGGNINIDLSNMQFNGMGANSDEIVRRVESEIIPKIIRAVRR